MHFFYENVLILIKMSLKFIPMGPINNIPALVQIMAWHLPGNKPLSQLIMIILLIHIYMSLDELTHKTFYFTNVVFKSITYILNGPILTMG